MRCNTNVVRMYLGKIAIVVCSYFVLTIVNFQQLHAQILGTESQQIKWLSTSALRSWFSNMGAEVEFGRRDRQTYIAVDQIDGLCWPNEFNIRMKGVKAAKALWIGTKNFLDPVSNANYQYKVVCAGKDAIYSGTEIFADELTLSGRFPHPNVYVDNARGSARDYDDNIDKTDNTQLADRVMINRFHTSIGVSVTRKVLSFSQQYNNNYYIYEYTLKNTGIIDESGQKKLNNTLQGVVFYTQTRVSLDGVSYTGITGAAGWAPSTTTWGRNTITDVIRKDGTSPGEFRANISYWGPMSTTALGSPAADIGLPGPSATNVYELAGYEFVGTVVLHADNAPGDTTDDITQPSTTTYVGADNTIDRNQAPTQYNSNLMSQKYTQYMTAGHNAQTLADQVGKDANGWPTGPANTFGTDAGGYMSAQGFGPYDLAPGDSVRIVVAEAVAGIDWNKGCEVARNWFANNTSTFVLPKGYKNGGTTTDRNEYKNAWVFSGKDSLFQTFRRAQAVYSSNYAIPQPPPPPDKFLVNSGGDRIKISWSASAESSPHFDGYRLYRCEGRTDTTYDLILECGKSTGNLVNSYDDQNAKRGFNYYYYIQSKSDGSDNPGNSALNIAAGVPLVSSRYYTMTNNPGYLTRPAGVALTVISDTASFHGDDSTKYFVLPVSVLDSTGTVIKAVSVSIDGIKQIPASFAIRANTARVLISAGHLRPDTLVFVKAPHGTIEVQFISPINPQVNAIIIGDGVTARFVLPKIVVDSKGNAIYNVRVDSSGHLFSPSRFTLAADTIIFTPIPSNFDTLEVILTAAENLRNYALSTIRIVPNPFNIKARNMQYGTGDPTNLDRLGFFNLPPVCKIKIYTELGDLITTIDHNNGSGDDYWQSLTSSRQIVVSGLYIAYFEVTENSSDGHYRKGDSIFKKFIIIR
jgi:hypothetical protein